MEITYHIFSALGDYDHNEDSAGAIRNGDGWCFTMADGLGGHGCGEVASQLAVEQVKETFAAFPTDETDAFLDCAFTNAQQAVMDKQSENGLFSGMKTTLTVLTIQPGNSQPSIFQSGRPQPPRFQWGHVGDSRVYMFGHTLRPYVRTLDHSVPQMLVASGEIKEKDIRGHADRNRLLRVIGTEWDRPRYELSQIYTAGKNDSFLLCSDGFWELIEEKTMMQLLKRAGSVEEWVESMAEEVRRNGEGKKMDNYTAVGVWLRDN